MEWISVEDQLPEIGHVCILYQTYPKTTMFNCRANPLRRNFTIIGGLRYNGKFIAYHDQYNNNGLEHITHWMPLPDPPKDENEK